MILYIVLFDTPPTCIKARGNQALWRAIWSHMQAASIYSGESPSAINFFQGKKALPSSLSLQVSLI